MREIDYKKILIIFLDLTWKNLSWNESEVD